MPAAPTIRPACADDLAAIFQVHMASVQALCASAYSAEHIARWFEGRTPEIYQPVLDQGQILVAEAGGKLLGFVGAVPGEVITLFIRPDMAGQGLGRTLFAQGLACAQAGFDSPVTVVSTLNAVPFYARFGFEAVEEGAFFRGAANLAYPVVKMVRRTATAGQPA